MVAPARFEQNIDDMLQDLVNRQVFLRKKSPHEPLAITPIFICNRKLLASENW